MRFAPLHAAVRRLAGATRIEQLVAAERTVAIVTREGGKLEAFDALGALQPLP